MNSRQFNVSRQRGVILLVAMILLIPMAYMAGSLATRSIQEETMAGNQRSGAKSLFLADTGIEHAIVAIQDQEVSDFNSILEHANTEGNENELLYLYDDEEEGESWQPLKDIIYDGGTFSVTIRDNDDGDGNLSEDSDGKVILSSVGGSSGGIRRIEVLIELAPGISGIPYYGILTEDHLRIDGNMDFNGTGANIHSNTEVEILSNATIDQTVSSAGPVQITGNPTIGQVDEWDDLVDIPHIIPSDFRQYADYVFTCDCEVREVTGPDTDVFLASVTNSNKWHGWACEDGKKWFLQENGPSDGFKDGFFYIHGNTEVKVSPGESESLYMSLISEGYILVDGNPQFFAFGDESHPASIQDLLYVAGGDLLIKGNSSNLFHGVMATHQEIEMSGNPKLEGSIVANNHSYWPEDPCQEQKSIVIENKFSGEPELVNNQNSAFNTNSVQASLAKLAWHELVN